MNTSRAQWAAALLCFVLTFSYTSAQVSLPSESPQISHLDQANPELWDLEMLKEDIGYYDYAEAEDYPMDILPFPRTEYNNASAGVGGLNFEAPFQLAGAFFMVGRSDYNQEEFEPGTTHRSFFNILVLTDTLDLVNYTTADNFITSRNHPDYVGQGKIKTLHFNIDYVAFHRPDHTSYAIVGTRFFDLQEGQTILVAPQKNGAVHLLQLRTPKLYKDQVKPYFEVQLKRDIIREFFEAEGCIDQ